LVGSFIDKKMGLSLEQFGWKLYQQITGFIIGTNYKTLPLYFSMRYFNEVLLNEGLVKIRIKHAYPELSISFMIILMF
jgi:hypothetical protein